MEFDKFGFQCSTKVFSLLQQFCTQDDFKKLRLDPHTFVNSILNVKLERTGKLLEIDSKTTPPTIGEKVDTLS